MNTKYLTYGKTIFLFIMIYFGIDNFKNLSENSEKAFAKYNDYFRFLKKFN